MENVILKCVFFLNFGFFNSFILWRMVNHQRSFYSSNHKLKIRKKKNKQKISKNYKQKCQEQKRSNNQIDINKLPTLNSRLSNSMNFGWKVPNIYSSICVIEIMCAFAESVYSSVVCYRMMDW